MVETTKGIQEKGSKAGTTVSSPVGVFVGLDASTRDKTRHVVEEGGRAGGFSKDVGPGDIEEDSFLHEMSFNVREFAVFSVLNSASHA